MTIFATVCRECGVEFEPTKDAIVRGRWHVCLSCQPKPEPPKPVSLSEAEMTYRANPAKAGRVQDLLTARVRALQDKSPGLGFGEAAAAIFSADPMLYEWPHTL